MVGSDFVVRESKRFTTGVYLPRLADNRRQAPRYGGQEWTAHCLVVAEQRHIVSHQSPYGEGVLDNFYLQVVLILIATNQRVCMAFRGSHLDI